jgi:tripartite-type tricarboxylate transporter receptor subunit TctC
MRVRITLLACLVWLSPTFSHAQSWPTKPIHVVVSSGAGGTADILARLIGERLAPALGQPVIIENRPGAGGHLGAGLVARAEPDGYTLLMSGSPTHSVGPHLFKRLTYEPMRDVPPVAMVAVAPNLLVVNASLPARSLEDLVQLAREKPGELTYSSAGNGTSGHLAAELLKSVAWIDMRHVPYKSGPEAVTGVLSGDVIHFFHGPRRIAAGGAYWSRCEAPSLQIASTAAMIAGPRNNPTRPNVSRPPKMPRRTHRKGRRVAMPISAGGTK